VFRYSILIRYNEADGEYVATIPELPGVSAVMPTPEEAAAEVQIAARLCLESLQAAGHSAPPPRPSAWPTPEELKAAQRSHYWLMVFAGKAGQGNVRFGVLRPVHNGDKIEPKWTPHSSSGEYWASELEEELGALVRCVRVDRRGNFTEH